MSLKAAASALMLEVAMDLIRVYRNFIPYVYELEAAGSSMLGVLETMRHGPRVFSDAQHQELVDLTQRCLVNMAEA